MFAYYYKSEKTRKSEILNFLSCIQIIRSEKYSEIQEDQYWKNKEGYSM